MGERSARNGPGARIHVAVPPGRVKGQAWAAGFGTHGRILHVAERVRAHAPNVGDGRSASGSDRYRQTPKLSPQPHRFFTLGLL